VGKITEKAVCRSVFLTSWHCILAILPTGVFSEYKMKKFFFFFLKLLIKMAYQIIKSILYQLLSTFFGID